MATVIKRDHTSIKKCRFIKPLDGLSSRHRFLGGKAANLDKLVKAGFSVPRGFVILTTAFNHFLMANHLSQIKNSKKLEKCILKMPFPDDLRQEILTHIYSMNLTFIAIRSSATQEDNPNQSYAGLFDTFFSDSTEMLFYYIKKCWISLFNKKTNCYDITYDDAEMAVLVQTLIFSHCAGVAFSNDPITFKNEIIIEACIGMGSELVSGRVTPDYYRVDGHHSNHIEKNIQVQKKFACWENEGIVLKPVSSYLMGRQKLSDKQIQSLSMLVKKIEKYFKSPVDVEWALEKNHFYILQTRPITAFSKKTYEVEWNNHQTLWETDLSMRTFSHYSDIPWNQTNRIYATYVKGHVITYRHAKDRKKAEKKGQLFINKSFFKKFRTKVQTLYKKQWGLFHKLENLNFSTLTNENMVAVFEEVIDMISMSLSYFRASDATESSYLVELFRKKISDPSLFFLLLTPHHIDLVDKENRAWLNLLKKNITKNDLLFHAKKYPWIMTNYFSFKEALHFLREKYAYDKKHLPKNLMGLKAKKYLEKRSAIRAIFDKEILYLIEVIDFLATSRMKMKNGWAGIHFYLFAFFDEITKRTGEKVDHIVKYYLIDEIKSLIISRKKIPKKIKLRRYAGFKLSFLNHQLHYENDLTTSKKNEKREFISGKVANTGKIIGIATVLLSNNKKDYHAALNFFKKQDILVTDMIQPQLVDIASMSGAIVTDEGGILSHAAILARELNIPCIVGTHDATNTIRTGDLICIDAFLGTVTILSRA